MAQTPNWQIPAAPVSPLVAWPIVNGIFEALRDGNAGPTAPSPTYPHMVWVDTSASPPLVKRRNADNSAWVLEVDALGLSTMLVPSGAVMHFAMNAAPAGWLKANGAAVSRTAFASLFAAIGTSFGAGDGSTTFNLPDLRGEFLRGWDDGRGVDAARAFGSAQAQAIQSHDHALWVNAVAQSGSTGRIISTSGATSFGGDGTGNNGVRPSGGPETRPRNIALLACIKF